MKTADQLTPYKAPVLATMFRVLGGLILGLAALGFIFRRGSEHPSVGLPDIIAFASAGLVGLIQIGIGEVIDLIGRIAHHTKATYLEARQQSAELQRVLTDIDGGIRSSVYQSKRATDVLEGAEVDRTPA